jgi:hypothetical protein
MEEGRRLLGREKYAPVAGNMRRKKKILSDFIFRAMMLEELDRPPGFLTK